MRTRSSSNLPGESPPNPSSSNLKRRNRRRSKQPFILEESPVDTMADQRTMAELLRAPTEGYAEAIVIPLILAEQFELKQSLINMMTSNQFFELEQDNPHDHIRWFNKITSTIKYKDVPNSAIKLMLFPFSLAGAARRWLEKEPPRSILTWEDLVSKFINEFFPPLKNDKSLWQSVGKTYSRCVDDYRKQIQGPHSRNKLIVSQVKSSDANSSSSSEIAKLTHVVNQQTSAVTTVMTAILKQFQATPPPTSVKAVEEICVTCGGAHPYYQCLAADGNTFLELRDNIQGYITTAAVNYNQGNSGYRPLVSMSNQTNKLKNMMVSFFQMNTASTSGSGPLPSNTIANPKGELKAITTQSGIVLDGPPVHILPPFINPEKDKREKDTLTDQDLAEYTIKVPPPIVQKPKPPSQRNFFVHQKDPLYPNIPYPSRMHKKKQQEKDEVQIHKFWQMFKQLHINITLADALILIPKYQKILKALLSNKEKLLELENTPLNENCSACKALANLGASINLMPLSVWKKLESLLSWEDLFLRTTLALIDVHGKEMILRDGDERLTLNMRHDTSSYSNQPQKESVKMINIYDDSSEDFLEDLFATNHQSGSPTFSSHIDLTSPKVKYDIFDPEGGNVLIEKLINLVSTKDLPPPHNINSLSGNTISSSPNHLLEEFTDELALITFPLGNDDLPFDIESDLKEIEYLLNHVPIKDVDSILEDSIDESNLADLNDNLIVSMPEMFTDKHALNYSSPPLYDEYDDDFFEVESDTEYVYDDPFDSKGEKIKESKLLIDELDLLRSSDFIPSPEYDSFLFEDFFEVDALTSTDNEDKVFNPSILIQDNLFEVNTHVAPDKNVKKLAISHASLILKDFDPPLFDYELPFLKEVLGSETLLSFSSENKEKVFKPEIFTSKGVHSSLLPKISHRGPKAFKVFKLIEARWRFFLAFIERTSASWMFLVSISILHEQINSGVRSS
nr:hypothetical protein [Tanacetum cinerariifolium]